MHAMRTDAAGKRRIARHKKNQPTRTGKRGELSGDFLAPFRTKMPINHACAARQALGDRNRIRRS